MLVHRNIFFSTHPQIVPDLNFDPISDFALTGEGGFGSIIRHFPSFGCFQTKRCAIPGWVSLFVLGCTPRGWCSVEGAGAPRTSNRNQVFLVPIGNQIARFAVGTIFNFNA